MKIGNLEKFHRFWSKSLSTPQSMISKVSFDQCRQRFFFSSIIIYLKQKIPLVIVGVVGRIPRTKLHISQVHTVHNLRIQIALSAKLLIHPSYIVNNEQTLADDAIHMLFRKGAGAGNRQNGKHSQMNVAYRRCAFNGNFQVAFRCDIFYV